jgi:hypothetical protein
MFRNVEESTYLSWIEELDTKPFNLVLVGMYSYLKLQFTNFKRLISKLILEDVLLFEDLIIL